MGSDGREHELCLQGERTWKPEFGHTRSVFHGEKNPSLACTTLGDSFASAFSPTASVEIRLGGWVVFRPVELSHLVSNLGDERVLISVRTSGHGAGRHAGDSAIRLSR